MILKKAEKHFEEYLCVFFLGIMCLTTGWQIVSRTFGWSVSWQEEISRYCFIWLIYMGCAYGVRERKHIKIDVLPLVLKRKGKFVLNVISNILFFIFSLFIVYGGSKVLEMTITRRQVSTAVSMPMWIAQMSVVLGFTLILIRLIQDTYKLCSEYRKGDDV